MITKILQYQTSSGAIFKTEEEAIKVENYATTRDTLIKIISDAEIVNYEYLGDIADTLIDSKDKIITLLKGLK